MTHSITARLVLGLVLAVGWQMLGADAFAQDDVMPSKVTETTAGAAIPVDHLQVVLRPKTKDELETELASWMELLREKITEVGETELELKTLGENESGEELTQQLREQRSDETALTERARVVIDAVKAKGGSFEESEQFINAVSGIGETTDVVSFRATLIAEVTAWAKRDDGGKLWAKRAVMAFIVLIVFWLISKFAGRITAKAISHHPKTSVLLENFARRTTGGVVFVIGVLMALSLLGVQIGPMMAALGAGGFIVGFALQETLGSFASGMMIMIYRPFDVDDYVNVAGVEGTVKEMSLVSTSLVTIDNKVLVIPNKKAWGDTIINFTGRDHRRVDLVFGIAYDDDIQIALEVLRQVALRHELVLDEPAVALHVGELADSSVNLLCRPWVKTEDYWTVYWDLTRDVKEQFDAKGISFPFPQRDVHVYNEPVSVQ